MEPVVTRARLDEVVSRSRAAMRYATTNGRDDDLAFMLSANLHRRHLNESQWAMVAANIANLKRGPRADKNPPIGGFPDGNVVQEAGE